MAVNLRVKDNDIVLEIGSGHNPHPRSDILLDRELENDTERQRQKLRIDRPLVIADGEHLPFKNKSFDFIYCAQVLEHTQDPNLFVKELGRVGWKGLIITPHIIRERLFGWRYHRWYFWKQKGQLNYFKKGVQETLPHGLLSHRLFENTLWFRRQISAREKELNIYYFWKSKPVIRKASAKEKAKRLSAVDVQVEKIFNYLEFDWKKDLIFWFSWTKTRIINKLRKLLSRYKL